MFYYNLFIFNLKICSNVCKSIHFCNSPLNCEITYFCCHFRWSANQIIGQPDVFPNYGDNESAWATEDIYSKGWIHVC